MKNKKSEKYWKVKLTDQQYQILRDKGTEPPFSGKYLYKKDKGVYVCAACGQDLFSSESKYDSGSGWPSFTKALDDGKIELRRDTSHNMVRIEVLCSKCGSHLGHLFEDGPGAEGKRYCINSMSLDFRSKKIKKDE